MQLPGFVAFLQRLSDGEATGPVMVGRGELGTSPADCIGDSWGSPVPSALRRSALTSWLQPLLGHFVVCWQ